MGRSKLLLIAKSAEAIIVFVAALVLQLFTFLLLGWLLLSRPGMLYTLPMVEVDRSGTPYLIQRDRNYNIHVYSLDGELLATHYGLRFNYYDRFMTQVQLAELDSFGEQISRYRHAWSYIAFHSYYNSALYAIRGGKYFAEYSTVTRRPIRYLSRKGFTEGVPPRTAWFDGPMGGMMIPREGGEDLLLLYDDKIHIASRSARRIRTIYQLRTARPSYAFLPGRDDERGGTIKLHGPRDSMIVLLEGNEILLLDLAGDEVVRVPLPVELKGVPGLTFGVGDDNIMAVWNKFQPLLDETVDTTHVFIFDAKGAILKRHEVPAPTPPSNWLMENIGLLVSGAVIAMWAFWLARRRGLSRPATAGWTLSALVFQFPALAVLATWHEAAPLTKCPDCQARFPSDRKECPKCGADISRPETHGPVIIRPA